MKLWRIFLRMTLYSLPIIFYFFLYYYDNGDFLRDTLVYNQVKPEPTHFSRPPEIYDLKSFGAPIRAGFSKKDITPPRWSWLGGFLPFHPGVFINDQLWVKSLALQDQRGHVAVIVTCDLVGLLPDEVQKIKSRITDVDPDHVFIACTHTHSGPDTMGIWGILGGKPYMSGKNEFYLESLRQSAAEVINESVVTLQNSAIRFGVGEFPNYSRGRYENPPDPVVAVMQVLISNTPVTLVNYACHPTCIRTLHVTADFPYYLDERLKILTAGETMFVQRAVGGVQPNYRGFSYHYVKTLGEDLADKVFRILKNPIIPNNSNISFQKKTVQAPLENKRFEICADLGILSDLKNENNLIAAEVNRIQIGPAEILTVPGELFPKIWRQVEPLMKGKPKFIFGLTNGEYGYILLPEDFQSGKHRYNASVSIGPLFGTEIEKALKELAIKD